MKYEGKGKEQVRAWVNSEEVERVLNDFAEEMEIEKADLEKDTLSAKIITNWVEWVEKDENWEKARVVLYDFVEDTQTNLKNNLRNDYRDIPDSYKKFFIYKYKGSEPAWGEMAGTNEAQKKLYEKTGDKIEEYLANAKKFVEEAGEYQIGDPDSDSVLLQNIYECIWDKDMLKLKLENVPVMQQTSSNIYMVNIENEGRVIASDTMTSAMVRFTDVMKIIMLEPSGKRQKLIDKITAIHDLCISKGNGQNWWTTRFCIIMEAVLNEDEKKEFYSMIDEHCPSMRKFLDLCHTIGNYCPIPIDFNNPRSGRYGKYDYWDLTLQKIKEYYDKKISDNEYDGEKELGKELLHGRGNMATCKEWLDYFGSWEEFIKQNYMQDYINDKYDIVPFWENHGWEDDEEKNPSLPEKKDTKEKIDIEKTLQEINKALQEINRKIIKRSLRIVIVCRNKLAK